MIRRTILVLILLTGCSTSAPQPAATQKPLPTAVPTPTPVVYSDAQKTALVADNIDVVYCGEPPKPDWCGKLHRVNGSPDVAVEGTSLFVATTMAVTATARSIAVKMCSAIAVASFDDNAQPIGFYHVHIQSRNPETFLADCDVAR